MKQFSLEEFKKNPNRKVVTRSGRPVRILCTDAKGDYPVIALISSLDDEDYPWRVRKDGAILENEENDSDLFFAPEKKEGWVNIYRLNEHYAHAGNLVFKTKEEAVKSISSESYVDTAQVTWEE